MLEGSNHEPMKPSLPVQDAGVTRIQQVPLRRILEVRRGHQGASVTVGSESLVHRSVGERWLRYTGAGREKYRQRRESVLLSGAAGIMLLRLRWLIRWWWSTYSVAMGLHYAFQLFLFPGVSLCSLKHSAETLKPSHLASHTCPSLPLTFKQTSLNSNPKL